MSLVGDETAVTRAITGAVLSIVKELTDNDIRMTMLKEQQDALEQDMAPFGFVITGLEDENIGEMVDEYGTRWSPVVRDYTTDW